MAEDQSRKREMRLLKNREAARECRRKKKEYIKCLENRVAVLENQNKALIDELKSLKELYCQTKSEWESVVVVPKTRHTNRQHKSQQQQQPTTSNNYQDESNKSLMIVTNNNNINSDDTDEENNGQSNTLMSTNARDTITLNNPNIINNSNTNNKEQKIVFLLV